MVYLFLQFKTLFCTVKLYIIFHYVQPVQLMLSQFRTTFIYTDSGNKQEKSTKRLSRIRFSKNDCALKKYVVQEVGVYLQCRDEILISQKSSSSTNISELN